MMIDNNTNQDSQQQRYTKNNKNAILANSKPMRSLPTELIFEILQWLPVLSLLKCRSVCKLWLSLISSPNFIKTHLLKSSETSQFADSRIITCPILPPYDKIKDYSVYSNKVIAVDHPVKGPCMRFWIVGSCNGLVCLAAPTHQLFLWNPATRKSKELQNSEIMSSKNIETYKHYKTVYGFGYDEHNDDYKVVGIFCFRLIETSANMMEVKIYSSRLDCWRSIEDFPSNTLLTTSHYSGKFASGVLHWAAVGDVRFESRDSWIIVSLNLKTEEYGEVAQPKYGEGPYDLTLGTLERSLCVLCKYHKVRADVWAMKEYGVTESWTKLFSIPYVGEPRTFGYPVPLCISASGELVMEIKFGIVVYNFKNHRFKDTVVTKFSCYASHTYIESLVSPNV